MQELAVARPVLAELCGRENMADLIIGSLLILGFMGLLLSFPYIAYYLTTAERNRSHWWNVMWCVINDHRGLSPKLLVFFFILCPMGIFGFITGVYSLETESDYIFAIEIAVLTGLVVSNKSFLRLHKESTIAKLSSASYCVYIGVTSYMYSTGSVDANYMMKNWVLYSLLWGVGLFISLVKLKTLDLENA